jgi:hypothetical protein
MNRMGTHLIDPWDQALRKALSRSIGKTNPLHERGDEQIESNGRPGLTF